MVKKTYSIPVHWEMEGLFEIEADSLDDAIDILYQKEVLPKDQYYVGNSLEVQPFFLKQHHNRITRKNQ